MFSYKISALSFGNEKMIENYEDHMKDLKIPLDYQTTT